MQALVLEDYKELAVRDVEAPAVEPNEALIRVHSCGICGSDVHGFDGSSGRRIPPVIMGHEASGIIEEVGPNVTKFKPGYRVTFDSMISCANCSFCRSGEPNCATDDACSASHATTTVATVHSRST